MDSPKIIYEHVFTNYIEHKEGSNEYKYAFPEHWVSFNGSKEIGLRSINVIPAARNIKLKNIYFRNDDVNININAYVSLSSNDDMTTANEKFKEVIKTRYQEYKDEIDNARIDEPNTKLEFGINDVIYEYDNSENTFWIKALVADSYLYFPVADSYGNEDFNEVMRVEDSLFSVIADIQNNGADKSLLDAFPNVIVDFVYPDSVHIKRIGFKNVWNRSTLYITSTISTLTEDKYLTLSNKEHNTLKWYCINGYVNTFSIFLFDACGKNSVEIPNDRKDLILIEMLLIAF